jgi:hypothetical protein
MDRLPSLLSGRACAAALLASACARGRIVSAPMSMVPARGVASSPPGGLPPPSTSPRTAALLRQLAETNAGRPSPAQQPRAQAAPSPPTSAPKAAAPFSPTSALGASLTAQPSLPSLLRRFMAARAECDFLTATLVLARAAALWRPSGGGPDEGAILLRGEAGLALLSDLHGWLVRGPPSAPQGNGGGGSPGGAGARGAAAGAHDPRVLASLLHSLAKLQGAVRNGKLLAAATERLVPSLGELPPRPLAMAAWALARTGRREPALFRTVAGLLTTGVCASWPKWTPQGGSGPPAEAERGGRAAAAAAAARAAREGSPFAPSDLALLATAFATAGAFDAKAHSALAHFAAPLLEHFPQSSLISLAWACSSSLRQAQRGQGGTEDQDSRLRFLFETAEEVNLRLSIAVEKEAQMPGRPRPAAAPLEPDALEKSHLAAVAATRARNSDSASWNALEDEGAEGGDSSLAASSRNEPMSPRALATVLHAFGSAGLRVPHLLGTTARFILSAPSSPQRRGAHRGLLSSSSFLTTVDSESLARIAWAFARARYSTPASQALWEGVVTEAAARTAAATAQGGTKGSSSAHGTRPAHIATWCWAATSASVPARPLLRAALAYAGPHAASFSVPALAQLLWAAAVQGEYGAEPGDVRAILEHVLAVAELKQRGAGAGSGASANPGASSGRGSSLEGWDPDAVAASLLLAPGDAGSGGASGVRKAQAQLYTAVVGLRLDKLGGPASAGASVHHGWGEAADTVPAAVLPVWRAALLHEEPRVSRLQEDVSRSLSSAKIEHVLEHVTEHGLVCDILVPPPKKAGVRGGVRGLVIEVQGPAHFARGLDVAQALRRDASGSVSFTPRDMVVLRDGGAGAWGDAAGDRAASPSPTLSSDLAGHLRPSLRTYAKTRWLRAAGYEVVAVSFAEWATAPSSQEKLELLHGKGLPVPERMLSWG